MIRSNPSYFRLFTIAALLIAGVLFSGKCFSQKLIKGTVTSDSIHVIDNVEVNIKGTVVHTLTNDKGEYFISAGDNEILVFSKEGYTTQEVFVKGREVIDVMLQKAAPALSPQDRSPIIELTGYLPPRKWLSQVYYSP